MKTKILSLLTILICATGFYSCEDDNTEKLYSNTITIKTPEGLDNAVITKLDVLMKEKNTGKEYVMSQASTSLTLQVPAGLYNISAEGTVNYKIGDSTSEGKVKGLKENVTVAENTSGITLQLFLYDVQSGLVFEEIFTTGTQTPEGKQYRGDSYFKIYNNSDQVIYADGYGIAESKFLTNSKQELTPNIVNEAFATYAFYMIPGNGADVPVEPGEFIILCDQAINHLEFNAESFDLSKANFEWYDETSSSLDTDNPAVPNLIRVYAETKTIWIPTNQGNRSYVLVKPGTSVTDFIANNKYDYEYETAVGAKPGTCYKIPNAWVTDAVNICGKADFEWLLTAPSLDMGWSYCSEIQGDKTRYGKSIIRKTLSVTEDGRKILQDTNNSTDDFIPRSNVSLKK